MQIQLKIKDNFYSEPDKTGKRTIIKRNVITKMYIEIGDIVSIGEVVNEKGNLLKSYSRIHLKEIGPIIVNHSVDYLNGLKEYKSNKIGFKFKNNK